MNRADDARVLPIGLPLGRSLGSPAAAHGVADGVRLQALHDEEWRVWTLAGGACAPDGRGRRDDLARAAKEVAVLDFFSVYYGLLRRRLLIETDSSGNWARHVTLQPLLSGLGELDREGTEYGLGVMGEAPFVRLDAAAYDAWQWLPFGPSLAAAAVTSGLASGVHGWATVADRVASLIVSGAAYLQATKEDQ